MPTQTFPCPFCGKKMGVGGEYLGKKVRCPNPKCNQVLVAPAATGMASPAPPPNPKIPTPSDLPVFNIPSQEARESIFGEQSAGGDDVFDSEAALKPELPDMPAPEPAPPAKPKPAEANFAPTLEMNSPFSGIAPSPLPVAPAPVPTPVVAPVPVPTPAAANPWAGMDEVPPQPAPTLVPVPVPAAVNEPVFSEDEEEPEPRKKPEPRRKPPARSDALFKIGFFVLIPYALIVTALAVYGLFLKSSIPAGHPLSNIPDNFGEYGPAERKKTGLLRVPVEGEIPPEQRVALGGKLAIGQLEIEPLAVEQRRLKIVTQGKGEKQVQPSSAPAIVMKMKISNAADATAIHPLDPAFNRKITGTQRIGTGLAVGKQVLWGGAISWPFPDRVVRIYEEAQEAEALPLKPGESRDYVIFTDANLRTVRSVRDAKDGLLWRVHLRRGRIDFEGKDIPVTAIIGVEFQSSDIKDQ